MWNFDAPIGSEVEIEVKARTAQDAEEQASDNYDYDNFDAQEI